MKAAVIQKVDGPGRCRIEDVETSQLPEGDVTVRISYSTLNYKDGLAITGRGPVVRSFPMVPGIDFVGTVESSDNDQFEPGDAVLLNGWGVGETHWGGLAEFARVKGEWLVPLPSELEPRHAMALGTAGYTAMLSVIALERRGVKPEAGEIVVTGAGGGVGGVAIHLLSTLGYQVTASTGRTQDADYLRSLGAAEVMDRAVLAEPGKPLAKERWAAAIDSVGSHTLANLCAGAKYGGTVTSCGLAQGMDFPASVAPFILRGVTLVGIDSVYRPKPDRVEAWSRLAQHVDRRVLDSMTTEIDLGAVEQVAQNLMDGRVRGRIIVKI